MTKLQGRLICVSSRYFGRTKADENSVSVRVRKSLHSFRSFTESCGFYFRVVVEILKCDHSEEQRGNLQSEQYFPAVLFIRLHKVVVTFVWYMRNPKDIVSFSNKCNSALLSSVAVCYSVECGSNI